MARIRTVKPEFWTNEDLAEVSEPARLLAIGLLNHSDDEGYFKANKSLIKAVVFPLSEPSVSIQGCLKQLSSVGYIRLFKGSDGKDYGKVVNFESHQRVNRPTPSKIKGMDSGSDDSLSIHGGLIEDSPPEGKGKEGKGGIKSGAQQADSEPAVEFLPTNKYGTEEEQFPITQSQIDEWQEAYPSLDCLQQVKQARLWLKANPAKRKTYKGMERFITAWLRRQHDSGVSAIPSNPAGQRRGTGHKDFPFGG